MWQANWISLGIIVTLFAWMVQRLASSMRPTIYASAASCRHIIVLPWKCKGHICPLQGLSHGLTVKRGVSRWGALCSFETAGSHEGQLCQASTSWSSWLYQPGGIPSGGFASHSRLELPPDWLLLTQLRWSSLCSHLGQLLGWQWWRWPPHPLELLHLHNPFHDVLSLWRGLFGWSRGCTSDKGLFSFPSTLVTALICSTWVTASLFPCFGVTFIHCHSGRQIGSISQ